MWAERMSCDAATIEEMPPVEGEYTVQLEHYPNCDGGAEISLYYVDGMTGGGWFTPTSQFAAKLDAPYDDPPSLVLDFFEAHPMS